MVDGMDITPDTSAEQILALIPGGGLDWRIFNPEYMVCRTPRALVAIYLDDQVPTDKGWAYRVQVVEDGPMGTQVSRVADDGQVNCEADLASVLAWL